MFWFILAIGYAIYAYKHIPQPEIQPPPTIGDVQTPTVEEGTEIPVLFGTREVKSAIVVWYGDFKSVPVKKKGGGKK